MAKFGDMPAELRNVLYAELLQDRVSCKPHQRADNDLALFTVSKQLHSESTSYFYQQNDIAIDAPSAPTDTATLLPPIADKYLRFLRRLTIHTLTGQAKMSGVRKAASIIATLAVIGARFDELNILISSPLSSLLNSRVDDSIMDADHPITVALQQLIDSGVAQFTRIELHNTWFAPGVAHVLHAKSGYRLQFYIQKAHIPDLNSLERPLTGRYSSTHLTALGLGHEDITYSSLDSTSSVSSAPSSLPSSLCSAFANLDTFSITSFEMSSTDDDEKERLCEAYDECDISEQPFFTEDDIEEWQASTQEYKHDDIDDLDGLEDINDDDDEVMEHVPQEDIQAFMTNIVDVAHHVANETDVTYMTNFAPDLLLNRHHLGHLA